MQLMLQRSDPDDYVIATGETRPLKDFVIAAFAAVGLNSAEHIHTDPTLFRPSDIQKGMADPSRAADELGWRASKRFDDVVSMMVEAELECLQIDKTKPEKRR
jgi:GDPmannose 4,6-dehydratase